MYVLDTYEYIYVINSCTLIYNNNNSKIYNIIKKIFALLFIFLLREYMYSFGTLCLNNKINLLKKEKYLLIATNSNKIQIIVLLLMPPLSY
jgi:hypothetical protein